MTQNDKVLLERAQQCDPQAIVEIYDRHAERVYRYLYRLVGDRWTAEDLTSEVFVRLLHSVGKRRGPRKNLPGWLYRVARNLAMDWFRAQPNTSPLELREELVSSGQSPQGQVEGEEQRSQLMQALCKLTTAQQQVILLRFGEGLEIRKVSQIMGKSEGAIKLLQYRAVRRLRGLLQAEAERECGARTSRTVRSAPATSSPGRKA